MFWKNLVLVQTLRLCGTPADSWTLSPSVILKPSEHKDQDGLELHGAVTQPMMNITDTQDGPIMKMIEYT